MPRYALLALSTVVLAIGCSGPYNDTGWYHGPDATSLNRTPGTYSWDHDWVYYPQTSTYQCLYHGNYHYLEQGTWHYANFLPVSYRRGTPVRVAYTGEMPYLEYEEHLSEYSASGVASVRHEWNYYPRETLYYCSAHHESVRWDGVAWIPLTDFQVYDASGPGWPIEYAGRTPQQHFERHRAEFGGDPGASAPLAEDGQ